MPIRIIVRRHAERPSNSKVREVGDQGLTPVGIQQARKLGRGLRRRFKTTARQPIFSSTPRPRAVQTAENEIKGGKFNQRVHILKDFPGLTRASAKKDPVLREQLKELAKKSNFEIIPRWIRGEISAELLLTPNEITKSAVHYLKILRRKGALTRKKIYIEHINHDTTIAALLHTFLGITPSGVRRGTTNNPSSFAYLEGIEFSLGKRVFLKFRKKKYDITAKFEEWAEKDR